MYIYEYLYKTQTLYPFYYNGCKKKTGSATNTSFLCYIIFFPDFLFYFSPLLYLICLEKLMAESKFLYIKMQRNTLYHALDEKKKKKIEEDETPPNAMKHFILHFILMLFVYLVCILRKN